MPVIFLDRIRRFSSSKSTHGLQLPQFLSDGSYGVFSRLPGLRMQSVMRYVRLRRYFSSVVLAKGVVKKSFRRKTPQGS